MIHANDGTKKGNPRIDTREVEYIALVAVCQAYLQGQISKQDLALFHGTADHNAHQQKELFGNHPIFKLFDFLWAWGAAHSLPEELELTTEQRKDHGIKMDDQLRMMIGYQVQTSNSALEVVVWNN